MEPTPVHGVDPVDRHARHGTGPQHPGVGTQIAEGDPPRLLHDVAELAGELQGARGRPVRAIGAGSVMGVLHGIRSVDPGGLHQQHVTADAGDGQAGGHTRHTPGPVPVDTVAWPSEELPDLVGAHLHEPGEP